MARRSHAHVGERRETPRARQAFADYAALPPGERSLTKLVEKYRTATESPPTRSLERLKFWSQVWGWQARLAVRDAEIEAAKRQEQIRQAEAQVRENNRLMQQVGQGSLALAACALNALVDSATGELKRPVEPRDLPQLMRAGGELLALATGAPTQIIGSGDATQLERCLLSGEDRDEVMEVVIDRLVELQSVEQLPPFVVPVRPKERNEAIRQAMQEAAAPQATTARRFAAAKGALTTALLELAAADAPSCVRSLTSWGR